MKLCNVKRPGLIAGVLAAFAVSACADTVHKHSSVLDGSNHSGPSSAKLFQNTVWYGPFGDPSRSLQEQSGRPGFELPEHGPVVTLPDDISFKEGRHPDSSFKPYCADPTDHTATPEPGTLALLSLPLVALGVLRRKRSA